MHFVAALACTLLFANVSAEEVQDGAPRIKIKVKGIDSAKDKVAVEKTLRALASVDDVLAGKDGTITILMKQDEKELTLRLSEITKHLTKAGKGIQVDNGSTRLTGKFRIEVSSRSKGVARSIKDLKGIKSVGRGTIGKGTVSFEVDAKDLNLGALVKTADGGKIDLVWTSPAKKKTGGGG